MTKKVFLGGTVNNSNWREELIKQLDSNKISCFNPVVSEWNEQVQQEEIKQRKECDFILYVITKELLGFYSIAEVVDDSNKRPKKTIFCYLEEGFDKDKVEDEHKIKSLQATARLVKANGVKVFTSLEEVAKYLNSEWIEFEWKEIISKLNNDQLIEDYFLRRDELIKTKSVKELKILNKDKKIKQDLVDLKNKLLTKLTEEEIVKMEQLWTEIRQKETQIQIPLKKD